MGSLAKITVQNLVQAPIEKTWQMWTSPEHIVHWNHASDDWHTTQASNDLQTGGKFSSTMAAKDGSFSFDFEGVHEQVLMHERIASTMADGRKMEVIFAQEGNNTLVTETFEAETENSVDLQRLGWQAILDNFKKYVESK
jgi:uncharacterized protein YndB with AHSA1/START domain